MKKTFLFLLLAVWALGAVAQTSSDADRILGVWIPKDKKSHIKIEKIGSKYYGKVIWLKEPLDKETGKPDTDDKNPDANLRDQPIMGIRVIKDFSYEGNGVFRDGKAYDPNNGKTYCGKITIIDNDHIDMRGCICGFSILGRTETWERYKE